MIHKIHYVYLVHREGECPEGTFTQVLALSAPYQHKAVRSKAAFLPTLRPNRYHLFFVITLPTLRSNRFNLFFVITLSIIEYLAIRIEH